MSMNETSEFERRLAAAARSCPETVAISSEAGAWTYSRLTGAVAAVATWLRGAARPTVVAIALPGGPEFTALQLGVMAAGSVAVPIPRQATTHEASKFFSVLPPDVVCVPSLAKGRLVLDALAAPCLVIIVEDDVSEAPPGVGPHSIVSWKTLEAGGRPEAPLPVSKHRLPERARLVQFTSGSTGWPKALLISEENLLANQDANSAHLDRFAGRHVFCPIPQFHAMGNAVALEHLLSGSSIHVANAFMHGEHFARMAQHGCSAMAGSPNYFRMLCRVKTFSQDKMPQLAFLTIGTDRVDAALVHELRVRFPDLTLFCRYGLSEAVGALAITTVAPGEELAAEGLLGSFVPGVEWQDAEAGDQASGEGRALRVRCATAAAAQWMPGGRLEAVQDAQGFVDTGDLVRRDERGRLCLVGRESQFIKTNGYRVNPAEVEEVLRQAPGVREAVVVGLPDAVTGQRIVACLTLDESAELQPISLTTFCLARLSPYKVPQTFWSNVVVPMTHSGKPARQQLVDMLTSNPPAAHPLSAA